MKKQDKTINRRSFIKGIGAAGLGSLVAGGRAFGEPNEPAQAQRQPQVPRRKFGRTGVEVPVLALGTMFNVVDNQVMLHKAYDWGLRYWDTAYGYAGGNSELGIGKFLKRYPQRRKDLFIATKASGARRVGDVEERLQESLKRLNTDYVDLYHGVHGLSDPAQLTDELKKWAENAKKRGVIRYFGFSCHTNMAKCLAGAAKHEWIDAVMASYNFRLMQDKKMQQGIEACHKAGIAVIAMKTQACEVQTEEDKRLTEHFLKRGFTEGQAKVKAVLQDERICTACVGRGNVEHQMLNIAAVLDKTELTSGDMEVFRQYAKQRCSGYCAGCAEICSSAVPGNPYISDIMRALMYQRSYGEPEAARQVFARIPRSVRENLLNMDYRPAEVRCPQHMPIGRLIAEAAETLA